jgi:hypothetical protein
MIGTVVSGHNDFGSAHRRTFPTWNETAAIQVLIECAIPLPPLYLTVRNVTNTNTIQIKNGDSGAEGVFCAAVAKHESVVSLQRAFRRQFQSDPPSANSMGHWYQQFQTNVCLYKGKSAGRPRVSEENVKRVRQSFLRSPKKSVRHASREFRDGDYDCVEGVAHKTGNETVSPSLGTFSSIILVHDVLRVENSEERRISWKYDCNG